MIIEQLLYTRVPSVFCQLEKAFTVQSICFKWFPLKGTDISCFSRRDRLQSKQMFWVKAYDIDETKQQMCRAVGEMFVCVQMFDALIVLIFLFEDINCTNFKVI